MSPDERRAIAHDVEQAVVSFFHRLDACDYDGLVELFAADGVWHRQGKALRGAADLMAAMRARPAGVTQHVASNVLVDVAGADRATVTAYLVIFAHIGSNETPAPMALPLSVAVYRAQTVRTAAGWRIGELTSQMRFKR
jgi:SnoaL-like domain